MERILKERRGNGSSSIYHYFRPHFATSVPIVVVFTKLDILRERRAEKLEKELEQRGDDMDDQKFEDTIDAVVIEAVQELCVKPLCDLTPSDHQIYPWIATSSGCGALQLSKVNS